MISGGSDDDFRLLRNWLLAGWAVSLVGAFILGALVF